MKLFFDNLSLKVDSGSFWVFVLFNPKMISWLEVLTPVVECPINKKKTKQTKCTIEQTKNPQQNKPHHTKPNRDDCS
jgi:hypothetical protein